MGNQTDELFIHHVAEQLSTVPGVSAVALGGSRATGEHRPDSDFDFAIYYRKDFEPKNIHDLGWSGTVTGIGDWGGGVMNGGCWLNVNDRPVDVHYRNLDEVENHLNKAHQGEFHVERLPFYLAGIPTYVVVGELALGKVLIGTLPKPEYPKLLRERAYDFWHQSALLNLSYAEGVYANQGDIIGVAGSLSRAVVEESHARLAGRGEWVLNEKRIVKRAGLNYLESNFLNLSAEQTKLKSVIQEVRTEITNS